MERLRRFARIWFHRQAAHDNLEPAVELQPVNRSTNTSQSDPAEHPQNNDAALRARQRLYSRHPLTANRKQIRVLNIQPSADFNADITATIVIADLDAQPRFAALSYVWGESATPNPDTISCDGVSVEVTRNCLLALRHLRRPADTVLSIWVDAICINQNDEEEKSHQINLMSEIYSSALYVYAWLGEGNELSDKGIEFLSRGAIASLLPFVGLSRRGERVEPGGGNNVTPPATYGATVLHSPFVVSLSVVLYLAARYLPLHFAGPVFRVRPRPSVWDRGLSDLLRRPWIRRIWTLQEAVMARELLIVCGRMSISGETLAYGLDFLDFEGSTAFLRLPPEVAAWRRLVTARRRQQRRLIGHDSIQARASEEDSHVASFRNAIERGIFWSERVAMPANGFLVLVKVSLPVAVLAAVLTSGIVQVSRAVKGASIGACVALCFLLEVYIQTRYFGRLRDAGVGAFPSHQDKDPSAHIYRRLPPLRVPPRADSAADTSLVVELHERQAREPKDLYFGMLSLIGADERSADSGLANAPGYTQASLSVIFRVLFEDILRHTSCLDILLFASPQPSSKLSMPSWAVDWRYASTCWIRSCQLVEEVLFHRRRENEAQVKIEDFMAYWKKGAALPGATPSSRARAKYRFVDGKELRLLGCIIGEVTSSSGTINTNQGSGEDGELSQISAEGRRLLGIIMSIDKQPFLGYLLMRSLRNLPIPPWDEGLWLDIDLHFLPWARATVNNNDYRNWVRRYTRTGNWNYRNFLDRLVDYLGKEKLSIVTFKYYAYERHCDKRRKQLEENATLQQIQSLGLNPISIAARAETSSRQIPRNDGRFCEFSWREDVGYAPNTAEVGDLVALIAGVSAPLILRQQAGSVKEGLEIVGPAIFGGEMEAYSWEEMCCEEDLEEIILV